MDTQRGVDDVLESARVAHRLRRYDDVHQLLSPLAGSSLPTDDLALLADAAWWLGRVHEVLVLSESLHHRHLAEGRVDRAAYHAVELAGTLFMSGQHAPALGWMNRAYRLLEGQPPCAAEGTLVYLEALQALGAQQLEVAADRADRLAVLGEVLGDDTFAAVAVLVRGLAEIRQGRLRTGFGKLDEAMLPVLADRVRPEWAGNIYCTIVETCIELAEYERARQWAAATERWVEQFSAAVMFVGVCRAHRVQLLVAEGAWAPAAAEAAVVTRELAELNTAAVAEAEYQLAESLRLRGELGRAREHLDRAAALGRDPQPGAALLELASGRPEESWTQICAAAGEDVEPFHCARLLRAQVQIGLAAGKLDALDGPVRRLGQLRDTYATTGFAAWADEAAGTVLLARGRPADALPLLRRAASAHRRIGAVHDRALVELRIGQAHEVLGDAVASRACAETGRALLRQLGAADAAPPPGAPRPPGGLTYREVEVLRLVATGATNRDAAAVLHLSEATVRRHLANIYAKLEVSSRTAAAAWAHEHGLVGAG